MKLIENIKGDKVIWGIVILLSLFSLLAVYSSTGSLAYKYQQGNTEHYVLKHFGIMFFGLVLMYLTHLIKFTYFSKIAQILLYIAVPLLLLTLILGANINEASRWLVIPGTSISFQSSDLGKIALIMFLSRTLSKKADLINADFKTVFKNFALPVFIICALIFPANFSTAAILFFVCFILLYIAQLSTKHLFYIIGIVFSSIFIVVLLHLALPKYNLLPRYDTWLSRTDNSKEQYQVDQAKIAIVKGGIFGQMPGNSTQRNFIPQAYSDFIFAIIIEEYGIIGGIIILLLYLILFYRAIIIAKASPNLFGAYLAIGLTLILVVQALINMGVAVDLYAMVTGQPLPLISMGGTSLFFTCISLGVVLSVSKGFEENKKNKKIA
jgi:cell division protein FtsW